ncbi:MAG: C10 family peptidase, partial [Bacteroidaceae bacterium]|nr:C10 family peptidase [Bacteroidaceae bacterium]
KFIVDNDIDPSSPLIRKRNKVRATKHSVPELLASRWNQGHPYNLTCPKYYKGDGSQHYPAAGCVATAMSQVAYYYKYPVRTKAAIPSHSNKYKLDDGTEKTVSMKAIPRNTLIDWEHMHDTYSCNDEHAHDRPDTAVANLMLFCGQGVKMGYGASSGASTSRARDFFVNYFGYNASAFWGGRGSYSIDDWFDMLYDEIAAGYPVLYAGHSSGGGHAFVLDGFDGENLFHVNWGWGGGSNGWFLVSILNPGDNSGMGASSSSDGYSMSQGALFSLRRPSDPKDEPYLSISDVSVTGTRIKATFTNKTGASNTFHTGIVMVGEDGSLVLVGNRQTISGMTNGTSQVKTFDMNGKLQEGTYRLSPASKASRNEVWRARYNMQSQYIEAVVDENGAVDLHFNTPSYTDIVIDTITFPGTRIVNQQQEVKVKFRNNGAEYFETVYFFASKTNEKVYTESKSKVAVRYGETVEVSYFFKPTETGTYNLWFCTDENGSNEVGTGTMEIITEEEAVKASLAVNSFTLSNGSGEVAYGKRLIGKATIRNNGRNDYHGGIRLQIWSQKIGSNTAYSGSTHSYYVDIAAGKSAIIEFAFESLSEGYYYRLKAMYSNQDGTLSGGGIWDHKWEARAGILMWKTDGTITGQAHRSSLTAGTTICGLYADCNKITRLLPNKNPNTIYAFAPEMEVPGSLDTCNAVSGGHANHIDLVNDKPLYVPVNFEADSASFTYTFPETEEGTGWHAFTLPFRADSIFVDDNYVALDDSLKHFWIYEFAAQGDNGEVIFAPAKVLRAETPYIIAADATMAGRSVVFRSLNAAFYKTGSGKMVVTSPDYLFNGCTHSPKVSNCYILNEAGTAFEYVSTNHVLNALSSYFTTKLPEEQRPESIVLPDVPTAPVDGSSR